MWLLIGNLNRIVRANLIEKVTFKQRPEGVDGVRCRHLEEEPLRQREQPLQMPPEEGACLGCLRNSKKADAARPE